MTNKQIASVVLRLCAVAIVFGSIACANSPNGPTVAPIPASSSAADISGSPMPAAALAQCLAGSGEASCFSGARVRRTSAGSAPLTSAPVLNNNQPVLTSGTTVTLFWTPPVIGFPAIYVIEASSTPGGSPNLANFPTGNASTTLVVPGVPAGIYYVRVRALDASGLSAPSNEVQVIVGTVGGGGCPSAPRGLNLVSGNGGTVSIAWQPPATGAPSSYVIQAGSSPNGSDLKNFDTNSTALGLVAPNVPAGSYFVRVYSRSTACAPPTFLGPASNEILITVAGGTPGWAGQIECSRSITGPNSYHHDETQRWIVGGPGQVISSARTNYPVQWSATGSGGGIGKSWTIGSTAPTDLSVTIVASTGIPIFDRTTTPIKIPGGIVGTPTSFDLIEIDFSTIVAGSANATSVSGTSSRPTDGGDSPQQPGGSVGTLVCTWSLTLR